MSWGERLAGVRDGLGDRSTMAWVMVGIFPWMALGATGVVLADAGLSENVLRVLLSQFVAVVGALTALLILRLVRNGRLRGPQAGLAAMAGSNLSWIVLLGLSVKDLPAVAERPFYYTAQILATVCVGVTWQILLAWQVHQQRQAYRAMEVEQGRAEDLRAVTENERKNLEEYRQLLLHDVLTTLSPQIEQVQNQVANALAGNKEERIFEAADDLAESARALSHVLADTKEPMSVESGTPRQVRGVAKKWMVGTLSSPLPVAWLAVAVLLLRLPVDIPQQASSLLLSTLGPLVIVGAVAWVGNLILARSGRWSLWVGVGRFVAIAGSAWWVMNILVYPVSQTRIAVSWIGEPAGFLPAVWITAAAVAIAGSLFSREEYTRASQSARDISARISRARDAQSERLRQTQERLADVLHGRVQGSAHAVAAALAIYNDGGGGTSAAAVLEDSAHALAGAMEDIRGALNEEPVEASEILEGLARQWEGVMNVNVDVSDAAREALHDFPHSGAVAASTAVNMCVNSFRHGNATSVKIRVHTEGDTLTVAAYDNGRGMSGDSKAGGGFRRVTQTGGRVQVLDVDSGCLVKASLPLR